MNAFTFTSAIPSEERAMWILKKERLEHVCDGIALVEGSLASIQVHLRFTQVKIIVER